MAATRHTKTTGAKRTVTGKPGNPGNPAKPGAPAGTSPAASPAAPRVEGTRSTAEAIGAASRGPARGPVTRPPPREPPRSPVAAPTRAPVRSSSSRRRVPGDASLGSLTSTASRVVGQAASILEEEISAGISAARQVEERFLDVAALRARDPNEIMQRFRQDAHELVDIVLDVVTTLVDRAANLTGLADGSKKTLPPGSERRSGHGQPGTGPDPGAHGRVATLSRGPIRAGERMELAIAVNNDSDEPIAGLAFQCSDLIGPAGKTIAAKHITITPSALDLGPRGEARVAIAIGVPADALPGLYSGVFQADKLPDVRAIVLVDVMAPQ